MPETGVVAYEGELRAFASGWSLPPGWAIARAQWEAPYWSGVGAGRPDRLHVDMVDELGWPNPITVAAAGCFYLVTLDIDGANAPRR